MNITSGSELERKIFVSANSASAVCMWRFEMWDEFFRNTLYREALLENFEIDRMDHCLLKNKAEIVDVWNMYMS